MKIAKANAKALCIGLISILLISMLATAGTAGKPGPTPPTPTSTAEAVQDQRLTNLETNDTNQTANDDKQQWEIQDIQNNIQSFKDWTEKQIANLDVAVGDLTTTVNDLSKRVINLENDPYPKIYAKYDQNTGYLYPGYGYNNYTEMSNFTFYLPADAYVYIEVSGRIWNTYDLSSVAVGLEDKDRYPGSYVGWTQKFYGNYGSTYNGDNDLEISLPSNLKGGNYSIHLLGWAGQGNTNFDGIYYTVIATKSGQGLGVPLSAQPKDQKIIVDKSGGKIIQK